MAKKATEKQPNKANKTDNQTDYVTVDCTVLIPTKKPTEWTAAHFVDPNGERWAVAYRHIENNVQLIRHSGEGCENCRLIGVHERISKNVDKLVCLAAGLIICLHD